MAAEEVAALREDVADLQKAWGEHEQRLAELERQLFDTAERRHQQLLDGLREIANVQQDAFYQRAKKKNVVDGMTKRKESRCE